MLRFFLSVIGGIFTALTLAMVFGAAALGVLLTIYADDLPSHEALARYSPPTISRIYSSEGQIIDEFSRERRLFVPIDDIPDVVKQAFISAEDKNFYQHNGYDLRGMGAAFYDIVKSRGKNIRGASTITQQVMKNFLLSGDRTGERKLKELILASRLEQTLDKDQILELYLNEIFLGQNSYGVAAAAQTYFDKSLDELTVNEAAMLASMPQAPSKYHPVREKERLLKRRNYVLREMWQNGYIDENLYKSEVAEPLLSAQNGDFPNFRAKLPDRGYFTDEIRRQLSQSFGEDEFFTGGLAIRATIDPELQLVAAEALQTALEKYDQQTGVWRGTGYRLESEMVAQPKNWEQELAQFDLVYDVPDWFVGVVLDVNKNGATIGFDPIRDITKEVGPEITLKEASWVKKAVDASGQRKNVTGMSDFLTIGDIVYVSPVRDEKNQKVIGWSLRQIPEVQGAFMAMDVNTGRVLAMQGGFSYQFSVFNRATQAMRQPGSSFKPFVYAAALDYRFTPATIVLDAPIEIETPQGIWSPKNASDKFYGPTTLRTGIEQSRNLMTVRVAKEIGMNVVAGYAERFGVYNHMDPFLANALGSQETTLFKMVAAYAMFANGGERVEPTLVDRVQDRYGHTLYRHDQRVCIDCDEKTIPPGQPLQILSFRERVMNPVTAYQLTSMLEGVVQRGTARRVKLPVPTAGKTGTTNESRDVWFVGYTSNIVAGCYIGYDQPRPLGKRASSGGTCGPVFEEFMKVAIKKYGGSSFKAPADGYFINIDRYSGSRLADDAEGENVVAEFFPIGKEPGFGSLIDGGFVIGRNLPLITAKEAALAAGLDEEGRTTELTTGIVDTIASGESGGGGQNANDGPPPAGKADFGTLSSGGLY